VRTGPSLAATLFGPTQLSTLALDLNATCVQFLAKVLKNVWSNEITNLTTFEMSFNEVNSAVLAHLVACLMTYYDILF